MNLEKNTYPTLSRKGGGGTLQKLKFFPIFQDEKKKSSARVLVWYSGEWDSSKL